MTGDRPSDIWKHCYTCCDYVDYRREVIVQPLADKADREGRDAADVVNEFMMNAHARHVRTGLPLRPDGPTRIIDPSLGRVAAFAAYFAERKFSDEA